MKNTAVYPAALFFLMISVQSCKKDSLDTSIPAPQANQYINASVSSGQPYTFNAGSSGILTVSRQASHYQVSQTETENGFPIYNYTSIAGYVGSDEVTLTYIPAAKSGNDGTCGSHHDDPATGMITIKLNVTN